MLLVPGLSRHCALSNHFFYTIGFTRTGKFFFGCLGCRIMISIDNTGFICRFFFWHFTEFSSDVNSKMRLGAIVHNDVRHCIVGNIRLLPECFRKFYFLITLKICANSQLCWMTFFHIGIILHVINQFCQRLQFFAFFPRLIYANVATLYVKKCWASNTQHLLSTTSFDNICCLNHIESESDEMSERLEKVIDDFVIHRQRVNMGIHGKIYTEKCSSSQFKEEENLHKLHYWREIWDHLIFCSYA